jgi:hypothetical protein
MAQIKQMSEMGADIDTIKNQSQEHPDQMIKRCYLVKHLVEACLTD